MLGVSRYTRFCLVLLLRDTRFEDQMITILIAQEDEAGESTRFGAQMGTIWITQEDEAGESDTDD
ncbi:hypothetical protein F2Q68_00031249 [Brassica cretica]|uniref:Uncharacterized protein n=1 Tax=Brassica cretica TaxID=69181 RepID=A0A8S9SU17_BRACR|nr:hypothetical protein F2Q68_00031249 [Brassica cretica]KAF3604667.1 hypothetical protein F2Q69_00035970 [Brassica cretica]